MTQAATPPSPSPEPDLGKTIAAGGGEQLRLSLAAKETTILILYATGILSITGASKSRDTVKISDPSYG